MKLLASIGNKKLGKDTLILNITSATDCPSKELGLCKLGGRCYALKAERMYKTPLNFRRRQQLQWTYNSSCSLATMILEYPIKYVRFSESGDFRTQDDVHKMDNIAYCLKKHGIVTYGYTARSDLDFSNIHNMVVNGSGFMIHNSFTAVPKLSGTKLVCPQNCRFCSLCKSPYNREIEVLYH